MFNFRFKYILSFSFLILSIQTVFSNLLPGNVVQVGKTEYSFVENLKQNQLVATLDERFPRDFRQIHLDYISKKEEFSDKAILIELKSRYGEPGLLMIGEDQYFHRQGVLEKLKPKLLKSVKRGNKKLLKILLKILWVKAKDLKVGDRLKGRYGETLFVKKVENVEFEKKMDFYELSLKHHHTFYVIDTAGNHVLTHNLVFLAALGLGAAIGFVVGAGSGAIFVKCRPNSEDGATMKEMAKGAFIGGVVGAVVGATVVIGIYYPSIIKPAIKEFIENHESVTKAFDFVVENRGVIAVGAGSVITIVGGNIGLVKTMNKKDASDHRTSGFAV